MLDAIDKRILFQVQRDASQSLDALAEAVGVSRNACWRRLNKLEADGVILKRVALLDPVALDLPLLVLVIVRASRHSPEWTSAFRAAVRDIPEIVAAYRTAGDIDYVIVARVRDVAAYDKLYQKLIARAELLDVSATFVMEEIKSSTELPVL